MGKNAVPPKKVAKSAAKSATKSATKSPSAVVSLQHGTKFYRMVWDGITVTTTFGPLGATGQTQVKTFATEEKVTKNPPHITYPRLTVYDAPRR